MILTEILLFGLYVPYAQILSGGVITAAISPGIILSVTGCMAPENIQGCLFKGICCLFFFSIIEFIVINKLLFTGID